MSTSLLVIKLSVKEPLLFDQAAVDSYSHQTWPGFNDGKLYTGHHGRNNPDARLDRPSSSKSRASATDRLPSAQCDRIHLSAAKEVKPGRLPELEICWNANGYINLNITYTNNQLGFSATSNHSTDDVLLTLRGGQTRQTTQNYPQGPIPIPDCTIGINPYSYLPNWNHNRLQLSSDGKEPLFLKVKRTTAFQKIYKAVTNHLQVTPHSFRLSHDGERLNPDETTPDDLNFDDEEVLDHFLEGVGGSFDGQDSLKQNMAASEDRMLDSIIINSQQENLGVQHRTKRAGFQQQQQQHQHVDIE
ncbi:hypothetical protein PCASD_21613 [Puccinia coronata f. sp. avenae]|uniref:Rad60/SUMO-like domain-containing protein n=1 Tax=Puccinia coronata f. sp. avenae TaxID=200324 RepID=A0A2N5SD60_9BASI|nr:hypothetical protein PCASD_21613 [Puccinia coronata f. sp. avenae]